MTTVISFIAWLLLVAPLRAQEASLGSVATDAGLDVTVQQSPDELAKRLQVSVGYDGSVTATSGTADVVGFPIIDDTALEGVEWMVNGSQVTGVVKNTSGAIEGTYQGTITATGVSGSFTHTDGRVGLWSWKGPLPTAGSGQQ